MSKSIAAKKAAKSNTKLLPNWLLEPIETDALLRIGFERTKVDKEHEGCMRSKQSDMRITNCSHEDEVLYYQPLDAVAYRNGDAWYLSLDGDLDHVWQGKLKNMGDLVSVLILLSK